MLNEVLPISPLPFDIAGQLQPVDEFYVCTRFTSDVVGAPIAKIGEDVFYRFMNYIYLPQPPESLSLEQVKRICDLRLENFDKLVDREINSYVVDTITRCIAAKFPDATPPVKTLDFGCGSGLSTQLLLDHLPELDIVGVDISEKAIDLYKEQKINAICTFPGEPLPFVSATFDLIVAVFVMHFNIDTPTLIELRRILRPEGLFVFNVYQRDTDGLTEQLEEAGFCCTEVWERLSKIGNSHVVMSCRVSPS